MTPADRYAFEEATSHLSDRWATDLDAIKRGPRLSWGPYSFLPLEDVPQGILLFHVDEPPEVRAAIVHELEIRLQDLLAWDSERRAK
jgi:hypothetical protein